MSLRGFLLLLSLHRSPAASSRLVHALLLQLRETDLTYAIFFHYPFSFFLPGILATSCGALLRRGVFSTKTTDGASFCFGRRGAGHKLPKTLTMRCTQRRAPIGAPFLVPSPLSPRTVTHLPSCSDETKRWRSLALCR